VPLINVHSIQAALASACHRGSVNDSAAARLAFAGSAPARAERVPTSPSVRRAEAWRRWVVAGFAFGLSVGGVASVYAASSAPAPPSVIPLQSFDAVGLPAGPATGVPSRLTLPAGTSLKHIHGGPTYVYVLSGSLNIIDSDGSSAAYTTGDFFPEAPGHVHTVQTSSGAEVFILQFLPPGAESLVPVE